VTIMLTTCTTGASSLPRWSAAGAAEVRRSASEASKAWTKRLTPASALYEALMARLISDGGAMARSISPPTAVCSCSSRPGVAGSPTATTSRPPMRAIGIAIRSRATDSGSDAIASGSGRSVRRSMVTRPSWVASEFVSVRSSSTPARTRMAPTRSPPTPPDCWRSASRSWLGVIRRRWTSRSPRRPGTGRVSPLSLRGIGRSTRSTTGSSASSGSAALWPLLATCSRSSRLRPKRAIPRMVGGRWPATSAGSSATSSTAAKAGGFGARCGTP